MAHDFTRLAALLFLFGSPAPMAAGEPPAAAPLAGLMPKETDRTAIWWRDGWPGGVEEADWRRIVETGRYWFMLDTDTMGIARLGSAVGPLQEIPGAELKLTIAVDGKTYTCREGGEAARFGGPRLIESGRFLQRADVTDLVFTADDGSPLNVDAHFETAAWADRLGLIFAARPGLLPIAAGEASFGRVNGGFGFSGTNRWDIPAQNCGTPETFTLEFQVFLPVDFKAGLHSPWLVCKNPHEAADGNYGILIYDGKPTAVMNIGGGGVNSHRVAAKSALRYEQWNHVAISYDGEVLRLYTNGQLAGETKVGKKRIPVPGNLTFGDRGDNTKGVFRFRGVVDQIRLYDHALAPNQMQHLHSNPDHGLPHAKPIREWTFRNDVAASATRISEQWKTASLEMRLANGKGELKSRWDLPAGQSWEAPAWRETALMIDPVTWQTVPASPVTVAATEIPGGAARPVTYESSVGWHRINLNDIEPIPPAGQQNPSNDALERVKLVLSNPAAKEQVARLLFEKFERGFRQRIGTPITGVSAILRDAAGNPTGIPVQLSKNWHHHPEDDSDHSGHWFHGISQVRLPPKATVELELTLAYGHWGGVSAASHAQLSLIGWGGNQRWDQAALGSWGESICFDPEQVNAACTITDVRPLMVRSMNDNGQWNWTHNVGGGDFFRCFDPAGTRVSHTGMRAWYHRQGPCLTEVTYAGALGKTGIHHRETVSLARSDDLVCATYRIRMDVTKPVDFSRFVLFQIGADTYNATAERKMAVGDETGLVKEWDTQWGGDVYRGAPIECRGRVPWASLHEAVRRPGEAAEGARANRGIVIREWRARLGGKEARPWMAERGLGLAGQQQSSTLDIVPPPGVKRLEPGDYVEATIEHIIVPQFAVDYYGPNAALRAALTKDENTWRMMHRQAVGDDLQVEATVGALERLYPDVRIAAAADTAEFTLKGGVGYVPVTFTKLTSHRGYVLTVDGKPVDQSVHGNDFWQTDYDVQSGTWSRTYNLSLPEGKSAAIRFAPVSK